MDIRRKRRIQNRKTTHPKCNRKYLERIDLEKQSDKAVKEKAKCTRREEYWKEKFHEQTSALEAEDHNDLISIINSVDDSTVPNDMKILWEQQQKIMNTSSPHGYRWHPK